MKTITPVYHATPRHENIRWRRYRGTAGAIWLVADVPNQGDHIIYWSPNGSREGYGGATLTFNLDTGETIRLQGPWHRNSDDLFSDTGIDVRNKHYTRGVLALEHKFVIFSLHGKYIDVVHEDTDRVLGLFNCIERMAQEEANRRAVPIHFMVETIGGSHAGVCTPN